MKTVVLDAKATNPGDNPWTPVEAFGQVTTYDQTSAADTLARAEGRCAVRSNSNKRYFIHRNCFAWFQNIQIG